MLKLDPGNGAQGAGVPTHEKTGLFFPQFMPIPGKLAGQVELVLVPGSGIPMRDYFAAKAMLGFLHPDNGLDHYHDNFEAIASDAYKMADAMIVARQEKSLKGFPPVDGDYEK